MTIAITNPQRDKAITRNKKTEEIRNALEHVQARIAESIAEHNVAILPPMDVEASIDLMRKIQYSFVVTMLDPWYNKGFGGVRDDYEIFIQRVLGMAAHISSHIYLWGFPEIVARFVTAIPPSHHLTAWLTWYYKNNPSVIRGWRSSQMACIHLSTEDGKLYPEHFLNAAQIELKNKGKLRYMPGPTSVIEAPLNIGFVGKKEQTGHPSQKPESVYGQLYTMTTIPGDIIFDPMAGSGTSGAIAKKLDIRAILCDSSEEYTTLIERRLRASRIDIRRAIHILQRQSP